MFQKAAFLVLVDFTILLTLDRPSEAKYPEGLQNFTTCEEFSNTARFSPYSVIDKEWFVFYYWGPVMPPTFMKFEYPPPNAKAFLHHALDEFVSLPINWTARFIVMTDIGTNISSLMVETDERGQYLMYVIRKCSKKHPRIEPTKVVFKQFDGGRYIAYMECVRSTVFLLAKKEDIPPKKQLQDVAAKSGYRSRGGKSYLSQGNQWMPIPEEDEEKFWDREAEYERERKVLEDMRKNMPRFKETKKKKEQKKDQDKEARKENETFTMAS